MISLGIVLLSISWICMAAVQHKIHSPLSKMDIQIVSDNEDIPFITRSIVVRNIKSYFGDALIHRDIVDTDIKLIEEILEQNPYIHSSNAYIDAHNRLSIKIYQRNPILRIMTADEHSFYLDGEANVLPLHDKVVRRVPIVTTEKNKKQLRSSDYKNILNLIKTIRQDVFLSSLVEQVHLKSNGEYIIIPKIGKEIIEFGHLEDLDKKLFKIKKFYKKGLPVAGWNKYKSIDLRYRNQLVCKKIKSS